MKKSRRRRRKSGSSSQGAGSEAVNHVSKSEEEKIIDSLVEAFSLASVEEAKAVYERAGMDQEKAAEILSGFSDKSEVQTTCSSSSGHSGSGSTLFSNSTRCLGSDSTCSSEGFYESNSTTSEGVDGRDFKRNRGKKLVAATGTVSTVLGKDYMSVSSKTEPKNSKGLNDRKIDVEEMEQFLCSMLGDGSELDLAVVKDVLCQYNYDVEKALDALLVLSGSSSQSCGVNRYASLSGSRREDTKVLDYYDDNNFWQLTDRSDSTCHASERAIRGNDSLESYGYRSYYAALVSSGTSKAQPLTNPTNLESDLPRELLESLFNIPKSSSVHEPSTMNWRNIVKKMETFAQKQLEHRPLGTSQLRQASYVKGAEYEVFRGEAKQHWNSMATCYKKAASAYSTGSKSYASYLSDQGKLYNKMAHKADEKASMEIFQARNKDIENVLTIDLHGQHVKPAMRLVKLHLLFGTYISSVQYLRVITGSGSHGLGKSKLKQSVINLLASENIEWAEENTGTVLIKLSGPKEFSFLDSESDTE